MGPEGGILREIPLILPWAEQQEACRERPRLAANLLVGLFLLECSPYYLRVFKGICHQ